MFLLHVFPIGLFCIVRFCVGCIHVYIIIAIEMYSFDVNNDREI